MPDKITSKNLSYDSRTPKFLAALQAQVSGSPSSPDPLLASRRRPGLKRSGSAEAEDAPLVVDDAGNVLEARLAADGSLEGGYGGTDGHGDSPGDTVAQDQPQKISITKPGRKRRAARVVGADEEDITALDQPRTKDKGPRGKGANEKDDDKTVRPNKKAKKIKLSFDDDAA